MKFKVGDKVTKVKGYEFSGEVVSAFKTIAGKERYVVECTVEGAGGMLHLYNDSVLKIEGTDYEELVESYMVNGVPEEEMDEILRKINATTAELYEFMLARQYAVVGDNAVYYKRDVLEFINSMK